MPLHLLHIIRLLCTYLCALLDPELCSRPWKTFKPPQILARRYGCVVQAAQQREQVQRQQLRQQHPPISAAGRGATAAAGYSLSGSIGMGAAQAPGQSPPPPQLHAQRAMLQKQAELRASEHGGFGAPVAEPGGGITGNARGGAQTPPPAWPGGAAGMPAILPLSTGNSGVPGSVMAPSASIGMVPMPSLSFLNPEDLVGDISASGSMHVPLDFTMTQVRI